MDEKSRNHLQRSWAESLQATGQEKTEDFVEGRTRRTDETLDNGGPIVEIVTREFAPAFEKEATETIEDVVNGKISILNALQGASPAVRKRVQYFIDEYAFKDMREVLRQLSQARTAQALLSNDPQQALIGVRLAQKEEELALAKDSARAKAETRELGGVSAELQEMIEKVMRDKKEQKEREMEEFENS